MTTGLARHEVDAVAEEGPRNSQPEGIGRLVAFNDLVCWNNLGRNVVFADPELRPRAVFGSTLFPGEDEASQYDLDVHAILDVAELGLVVVLNHIGAVRAFRRADLLRSGDGRLVEPTRLWWFVADGERTVVAAGRLVGSVPRSDGAHGLLVSSPLRTVPDQGGIPTTLCATDLGEVTALAVVPSAGAPLIAAGGDGTVALLPLAGDEIGPPNWRAEVGFRVATVAWHDGLVWAAGPDRAEMVDDYDWERLHGGGFVVLDPAEGGTVARGPMPEDVAWGTGGVAVAPFGPWLAAAGRTGCLYLVDPRAGAAAVACSTAPITGGSLGIAHVAVSAGQVLCGFNRGGYRLHACGQPAAGTNGP